MRWDVSPCTMSRSVPESSKGATAAATCSAWARGPPLAGTGESMEQEFLHAECREVERGMLTGQHEARRQATGVQGL